MAIRIIKEGTIECDNCGKEIAEIKASNEVYRVLEVEERFCKITCIDCKI